MSDFGTMQARINSELSHPELAARIPDAIQAALRHFEGERLWFNEAEATASTVDGTQAYAVPTDLIEIDTLTLTTGDFRIPLKRRPWAWMRRNDLDTSLTGRSSNWAYYADQIWLYPIPDAVYTLTISYLKRLSALSDMTDTNAWMTHGEELIRERAKADLLLQPTVRDVELSLVYDQRCERELKKLRQKSESKVSTGLLSLDSALASTTGYNINWE